MRLCPSHRLSSLLCALLLVLVLAPQAHAASPCGRLSEAVCKAIGAGSFLCKTYKEIAAHPKADHIRCTLWQKRNWQARLASMKRSEQTLKRMEALGKRSGPKAQQQIKHYKSIWSQCTVSKLLERKKKTPSTACQQLSQMMGQAKNKVVADKMACRRLVLQVCTDLSPSSFYCDVFTKLAQRKGAKPSKCMIMLKFWPVNQKASYKKRSAALMWMQRMSAKKPSLKVKLQMLKRREIVRIYKFLHQ